MKIINITDKSQPIQLRANVDNHELNINNNSLYWFTDTPLLFDVDHIQHTFHVSWNETYSCISVQIQKHHQYPCIFTFYVYHEDDLIISYDTFQMLEDTNSFNIPHTLPDVTYDLYASCAIHHMLIKNHEKIGTYVF